jgi:hypothetical protein
MQGISVRALFDRVECAKRGGAEDLTEPGTLLLVVVAGREQFERGIGITIIASGVSAFLRARRGRLLLAS